MIKLETLLESVATVQVEGSLEREISSLSYDSRRVQPGALFCALPGEKVDGSGFIAQALDRGAVAIVRAPEAAQPRASSIILRAEHSSSRATTVVVKDPRLAARGHRRELLPAAFARAESCRHHRDQRQDHHGLPAQTHLRARAPSLWLDRHRPLRGGRAHPSRAAHHPGIARSAGAALADALARAARPR